MYLNISKFSLFLNSSKNRIKTADIRLLFLLAGPPRMITNIPGENKYHSAEEKQTDLPTSENYKYAESGS